MNMSQNESWEKEFDEKWIFLNPTKDESLVTQEEIKEFIRNVVRKVRIELTPAINNSYDKGYTDGAKIATITSRQEQNQKVIAMVEKSQIDHKPSCNFLRSGLSYVHPCECGAETYNVALQTIINKLEHI